MIKVICDECESDKNVRHVTLQTGHVFIDGKHYGQGCDLCEKHYPDPRVRTNQPKNCSRVTFHWPKPVDKG